MAMTGPGSSKRRPVGLMIPIDVHRDTRWALVELIFCLQRDVRCTWRLTRPGRWLRRLAWAVTTVIAAVGGAGADHRFHLLGQLLHPLR